MTSFCVISAPSVLLILDDNMYNHSEVSNIQNDIVLTNDGLSFQKWRGSIDE